MLRIFHEGCHPHQQAARANINLTIDAEEVERLELSLAVFEALLAHVTALARQYRLRLMCRLVKGAYWDAEIKRAQELGLPHYLVFTHKHHTEISYLACAHVLLGAPDAIYPQFATHNAATAAAGYVWPAARQQHWAGFDCVGHARTLAGGLRQH